MVRLYKLQDDIINLDNVYRIHKTPFMSFNDANTVQFWEFTLFFVDRNCLSFSFPSRQERDEEVEKIFNFCNDVVINKVTINDRKNMRSRIVEHREEEIKKEEMDNEGK